jgi:hypothetical protein
MLKATTKTASVKVKSLFMGFSFKLSSLPTSPAGPFVLTLNRLGDHHPLPDCLRVFPDSQLLSPANAFRAH